MPGKRYALFAGSNYYPSGGWGDFVKAAYTVDELKLTDHEIEENWYDWCHIVDLDREMIIETKGNLYGEMKKRRESS
jgi:hypothetical protein